jgi:hypothetical protein
MTALAPSTRPDWRVALLLYRDDGPLARALGRLSPRRIPAPLPVVAAALPLIVLLLASGDDAPRGAVAGAAAWAVLFGGLSRGCSHEGRLAWLVPPLLRALEYGSIIGIAAVAAQSAPAGAFALLAAVAFRHYDTVYRLRHRGTTTPPWVTAVSGGWDGRLLATAALMLAGALPAAFYVAGALLAIVLVGESVAGWVEFARSGRRVVDDDEEDEDEGQ